MPIIFTSEHSRPLPDWHLPFQMVLPPSCSLIFTRYGLGLLDVKTAYERGRKQSQRCLRPVDEEMAGAIHTDTINESLTSYLIVRKKDIVKVLNDTNISSAVQSMLPSPGTAASSVHTSQSQNDSTARSVTESKIACGLGQARSYIIISATCLTSLPSHPRKYLLTSPSMLDEGSHWHHRKTNFSLHAWIEELVNKMTKLNYS